MKPRNLIFLHIPKTAGITFNQVLEGQYGKENVLLLSSISNSKKNAAKLKPLKDRDIVYRGHTLLDKCPIGWRFPPIDLIQPSLQFIE
jgi:hypothetical protein